MVDRLESFDDITRISTLKARYFRLMDTKNWDEWRQLLAPDAMMDLRSDLPGLRALGLAIPEDVSMVWHGRDAISAAVSGALPDGKSYHQALMPEIEIVSDREAWAIWGVEDLIIYGPASSIAGFRGYGHSYDSYVKIEGNWLIQSIRSARLFILPLRDRNTS